MPKILQNDGSKGILQFTTEEETDESRLYNNYTIHKLHCTRYIHALYTIHVHVDLEIFS